MLRYMASWPLEVTITTGLLLLLDLGLVHKCVGNPWRALLSLRRARSFLDHLGFHSVGEARERKHVHGRCRAHDRGGPTAIIEAIRATSQASQWSHPIKNLYLSTGCACALYMHTVRSFLSKDSYLKLTRNTHAYDYFCFPSFFFLGSGYA
jgi:hypothetical protein